MGEETDLRLNSDTETTIINIRDAIKKGEKDTRRLQKRLSDHLDHPPEESQGKKDEAENA